MADRKLLKIMLPIVVFSSIGAVAFYVPYSIRQSDMEAKLRVAVGRDDYDRVRQLLDNGANPNCPDPGRGLIVEVIDRVYVATHKTKMWGGGTVLIDASSAGDIDIVRALLQHGANPDFVGLNGTALTLAARYGHPSTVKLLIDHHAKVNEQNHDGGTALIEAARWSDRSSAVHEAMRLLLSHGADPTIQNNDGDTAMSVIINDQAAVNILKQAGADD